ncbi:SWIM-type domain-containing protein [Mycena venus]|uniref:SWIM-type domain-containing protein n=1 Tax=Mycena venus TaxID=2733690 RepID=A0A8H6Z8N1_9AGAR|nr:SWIM-type domain-containing protein [Mycena venus]
MAQRAAVAQYSKDFSCRQVKEVLKVQFPGNTLEPRQISNMRNKPRREAWEEIEALGVASLEETTMNQDGTTSFSSIPRMSSSHSSGSLQGRRSLPAIIAIFSSTTIPITTMISSTHYPLASSLTPMDVPTMGGTRSRKKEDAETHDWILRCHLEVSRDVHPEIFVSDRSGALIAAVSSVIIFTFHVYCLSHLLENIDKNLARALAEDWHNFLQDFWTCYRAVSPEDFEKKWADLVKCYPAVRAYLHDIYQVRDCWAWTWISVVFTAGIRTNGQVEVENCITKALSGPKENASPSLQAPQ